MTSVAYEFQALRTLRFARRVVVIALLGSVLGAAGMAVLMNSAPLAALDADAMVALLLRTNVALPVAAAVLGAAVMTGDVRRGLVLAALLRAGGRGRLWVSRMALATTVGAVMGATAVALTVAVVSVVVGPVSWEGLVAVGPGAVVLGVGWATVACGVGSVMHRPFVAAAVPVLFAYAVEPVLRATLAVGPPFARTVAQHLPFGAGAALVAEPGSAGDLFVQSATPWAVNAAVFLGAATAVAVTGFLLFRRADLEPTAG